MEEELKEVWTTQISLLQDLVVMIITGEKTKVKLKLLIIYQNTSQLIYLLVLWAMMVVIKPIVS